jgi:integrase
MTTMMKDLKEYIALRRALGAKLKRTEEFLRSFISFMEERQAPYVTVPLALEWATRPSQASPVHHTQRLTQVRLFATFLQAKDPRHDVPPIGVINAKPRRVTPYLYSAEEVRLIVEVARALPPADGVRGEGIRGKTCSTIFGLLAVTGMRVSEALRLDRSDVDLEAGVLTVRWTKFNKTRLVPLHPSTTEALRAYARERDAIVPKALSEAFFLSDRGTRVIGQMIRYSFRQVSRKIGIRGPNDRRGPRLHDLRHRFAVETLLTWYRQGIDAARRIPVLATYLGHVHVADSYWYLEAVPELLDLAACRMQQRYRRKS